MCNKKNNFNKYIGTGLLINSFVIISQRFFNLPEFFAGLGYGTAIFLMLFGVFSINHDISKVKAFKRRLFKLN